jgi:protein phosphatase
MADGMGGVAGGGVASAIVADEAFAELSGAAGSTHGEMRAALRQAVVRAHERVRARAETEPSLAGMGSTLVAALTDKTKVFVCNVGDSRAYLLRNGTLMALSVVHSLGAELERSGLLGAQDTQKASFGHILTMAIGSAPAVPVPSLRETGLRPGDRLVLCTDGVTGTLPERELAVAIVGKEPEQACLSVVTEALLRGTGDDLSILVAEIGP